MSMDGFNSGNSWATQSQTDDLIELEPLGELMESGGLEPQIRARSNTWPCPRPDTSVEPNDDPGSRLNSSQNLSTAGLPQTPGQLAATAKKNSSRRNAWGNLSYADLITQAITSAADNRLTLSQIYEWMVQNVPYFKDKGDSNSSAGWKNSIRHNLSLHNRFMRVQNEGTGKSSWWMINPDAKPGKPNRRRATSMETSKYEKRRGRVKKKMEAVRNGLPLDAALSPSSSVSETLDLFIDSPAPSVSGYQQRSPDFRQRASSNASSCGKLSPISSLLSVDPDWVNEYSGANSEYADYAPVPQADQLAGTLADTVKLHNNDPFFPTYGPRTTANSSEYCSYMNYALPNYVTATQGQFVRPSPPPLELHNNTESGTVMSHIMGALQSGALEDLNLHLDPGLNCNVDEEGTQDPTMMQEWYPNNVQYQAQPEFNSQVLNHELSTGESLDFNFQPTGGMEQPTQTTNGPPPPPYSSAPSWVH